MRDHGETRLQMAVVSYLRGEIRDGKAVIRQQKPFPGLIFLHPVNEFKDEKEAFWGKAKGILPGAPDLLFWWEYTIGKVCYPSFAAIELKTKSKQSPNQHDFQIKFEEIGGKYAICRKVSEVRDTLIGWGLDCKNTHCIEPRLSKEEILKMQHEIYKVE